MKSISCAQHNLQRSIFDRCSIEPAAKTMSFRSVWSNLDMRLVEVAMLNPVQRQRYQKRFSTIESSFRIEGMDPSGDPVYEEVKARVLAGELTAKQALAQLVEYSRSSRRVAVEATA
jgi:hypothetical protein